jgi:hypothetical protein
VPLKKKKKLKGQGLTMCSESEASWPYRKITWIACNTQGVHKRGFIPRLDDPKRIHSFTNLTGTRVEETKRSENYTEINVAP